LVRIRLMRVGKTKQPTYRVVVADQRSPRDGRIIEAIGHYNPRIEPSLVAIDTDRADYWLSVGAQPSDQVRKLIEIARSGGDVAAERTPAAKATRAGAVKATPAASVAGDEDADDAEPAATPEAEDQAPAAPDAEPEEGTEETSR
jgi:small subunit ribosomal protein S16